MIDTGAGVIDADYRGIVFVLLFNLSDKDFGVKEGDRIAQLIVERIYTPEILEVKDLDETLRGPGGFGSTGGHNNLDVSSS
ncbi:Deoxyuridine 5'-triphosphate nucleotidohydrolase [Termitomyces sp. Mn162]|nr:Deoxyuridine 5'-triphosphate nucleotidohydrolase [Termitomyces sp. Mn162]